MTITWKSGEQAAKSQLDFEQEQATDFHCHKAFSLAHGRKEGSLRHLGQEEAATAAEG